MIQVLTLTQVRISKFAVLFGDVLAFALAFIFATLLNVGIDTNKNIHTQSIARLHCFYSLFLFIVNNFCCK